MTETASDALEQQPTAPVGSKKAPSCTLVIFGAGGDLTKRLLMPSLYDLSIAQLLADDFSVMGVDLVTQDEGWRSSVTGNLRVEFQPLKAAGFRARRPKTQAVRGSENETRDHFAKAAPFGRCHLSTGRTRKG